MKACIHQINASRGGVPKRALSQAEVNDRGISVDELLEQELPTDRLHAGRSGTVPVSGSRTRDTKKHIRTTGTGFTSMAQQGN